MLAFTLNPRQQQVLDALNDKAPDCAKMYRGAVQAWADHDNPERLSQAAHSLRELMEKIGPYLDVPVPAPELIKGQGTLNDKFRAIEEKLTAAESDSGNWVRKPT